MGGRVEAIARELPEQVKRLESAADKKVVDAAARALGQPCAGSGLPPRWALARILTGRRPQTQRPVAGHLRAPAS